MSESLSSAEKNVWETLNNFQTQLEATFKDNQIVQDDALLNGFLSFVESRLTRMVKESLDVQQEICESARNNGSLQIDIDDRTVPLILRLYWEKICHPVFKWFQAWRKTISPKEPGEKPRYVEFRKMNAKLTKFFKSVHKFYYSIMEQVVAKYDCSALMPLKLREELNMKIPESSEQSRLGSNGKFAVLVVMTLHNCLLYLGTTHRYKAVGQKINNRYQLQDFEKSIRYLDMACLFLPSMGEAHLQKGLIYVQTNNFGSAVYQFTRSALARIPSPAAESNFARIICDRKSRLRHNFDQNLKHNHHLKMDPTGFINRMIIESYFLVLFGNHFAPQSWKIDSLPGVSNLVSLERVLYEKISTCYIKNTGLIFENLIIAIGGFDLLVKRPKIGEKRLDSQAVNLKDLTQVQSNYLSFSFKFISHLLHIIREAWEKNFDDFHYLAMVRVVENWLKCNRAALQYSHRDENFCKALALLLNDILKSDKLDKSSLANSKPTRPYFFEEDVMLKEFFSVRYALSDFNDEHIFASSDSTSRLMGYVPETERLQATDEGRLRLKAIVGSGRKFFAKNSCGMVWNAEKTLYEFGQQAVKRPTKRSENTPSKIQNDKRTLNTKKSGKNETLSIAELEEQFRGTRQGTKTPDWGYSGSSAPMAPSTFNTKPSSGMTESASVRQAATISSDGSVQPSSSSTTLSSYSSRSDEKDLMDFAGEQSTDIQEPISAEYLEKQQLKHRNLESLSSTIPHVGMPLAGFQAMGAIPYRMPVMSAQTAGPAQPLAAPSILYPPPAQPAMVPAQPGVVYPRPGQPMQMYQPNTWMAQPFYQQGPYPYGAQQSQHQLYGQGNNLHPNTILPLQMGRQSPASLPAEFAHR
ncbi:hypothetical protein HG536_0C00400 [Torulaspora globosa]|uniref:Nonsense-mediated mRNA decay factor n=1 Tax=Torulaspora globosa TaxID=48254 RepID=A0A7G3ZED7_9SACH|nr:uncharacterized protein HG536_0C00400 [Torulaspora globosa]QLL31873.1 hypothetical protein HG536_0C00400 [Torulaspora globosa]